MGARVKKASLLLALTLLLSSVASIDSSYAATKKPTPKPKPKVLISPAPKWPPAGFVFESGVYAKVPSSKQLLSVISAKKSLATQVSDCKKFVCGAVHVAA